MGCGGSKSVGPSFEDDVGPDGPLSEALGQLLVTGHVQAEYNGIYTRAPMPWNGKAMYTNGRRYLYYYNANEDGAPGWSFDHRDQPQTMGAKDWCAGGYIGLQGGPAYPPLGVCELVDVDDTDQDVIVTITEFEPAPPPAAISISGHPEADGIYSLAGDLWNGRPHYTSREGWCFYHYAGNEGGEPGWSLHPELVPQGAKDWCDGGWVGPYTWSHPPLGEEVGFNDIGRVAVQPAGGDAAIAAQVHALMMQQRLAMWQAHGMMPMMQQQPPLMGSPGHGPGMVMMAQPAVMLVQPAVVVAQPVMAQPVMAQPVV